MFYALLCENLAINPLPIATEQHTFHIEHNLYVAKNITLTLIIPISYQQRRKSR